MRIRCVRTDPGAPTGIDGRNSSDECPAEVDEVDDPDFDGTSA